MVIVSLSRLQRMAYPAPSGYGSYYYQSYQNMAPPSYYHNAYHPESGQAVIAHHEYSKYGPMPPDNAGYNISYTVNMNTPRFGQIGQINPSLL